MRGTPGTSISRSFRKKRLERLITERKKLLTAYHADATDVDMLRQEQERLAKKTKDIDDRLVSATATLDEGQGVFEIALRPAQSCAGVCRSASPATRKLSTTVSSETQVCDGKRAQVT